MKIVILGIPGVGKSSVVDGVITSINIKIDKIRWGDLVFEIAEQEGLVHDRDDIRKLSKSVQNKLQVKVVNKINELSSNANVIIETHSAIKTPSGFLPGLTLDFLKQLNPSLFVVIEAKAENIFKRRKLDSSRKRDDDKDIEEIQLHLDLTRQFASSFSVITGANLLIVENKEGEIDYAVKELTDVIDKLLTLN